MKVLKIHPRCTKQEQCLPSSRTRKTEGTNKDVSSLHMYATQATITTMIITPKITTVKGSRGRGMLRPRKTAASRHCGKRMAERRRHRRRRRREEGREAEESWRCKNKAASTRPPHKDGYHRHQKSGIDRRFLNTIGTIGTKVGIRLLTGRPGPSPPPLPWEIIKGVILEGKYLLEGKDQTGEKKPPPCDPGGLHPPTPLADLNPLTGRHTDGCRQKVNKNEERRGMLCFRSIRSCSQVGGCCLPVAARRWPDFPHSLSHTEP